MRPAAARHQAWLFGRKLGDWAIAAIVFAGGFVMFEPSPYELLLVPVVALWAFFGLKLNRHLLPMAVLTLLYVAGGILSVTQIEATGAGFMYMAITLFMALSSIFFATVIAERPERRLALIRNAYIAAAVVVSLIGILAYFQAIPGSDLFLRYARVKGTFKDPNVFGPFLILPATFLVSGILTRSLRRSLPSIAALLIMLFAIFLSFSRAAWGLAVFAIVVAALFAFMNQRRQIARFRLVASFAGGIAAVAMLLAVSLTIPAVNDLFQTRAHAVQDYDEARLGRFERHVIGFSMIQERPLGIGPSTFAKTFGEEEHNTWLKGFTAYGWLGGFAYIALVLWTIVAAAPLLFKPRPWQVIVQCTYAVFLGHVMIHNVIDNDHWRHLFLLYGILWGAVAAEKLHARTGRRAAALAAAVRSSLPPLIPRGPRPALPAS
jgi:O-antigen ligase